MTGAIAGGATNLATLWVPVLPEVSGFASKLAEGVVGGATAAVVSKFLDIFGEMAKKAAESVAEIAKGVYEIGEQFQTLEYQVSSFSDAQGAALEGLQDTAAKVFSQLDTGTKNLGENMDVFHQRLGVTGESLRQLTYDYTELTSRLGNVDARAFSAALDAYGVSGDKADAALRTLAADSRHYADTMSNLTTQLETANPVFDLLGIGFNGAAEAMAKIDAIGPNAMKVMNGIAMSGKEFAKLPNGSEDFKKFINDTIDAIDYYNSHGEAAKGQQLTWDMFGSRQAPIVLRSLKTIKEAMDGVGKEGRQLNVDEFVEGTRKLDQTWELFIHRLEFDLKPIGDTALKGLETGVKWLGDFLTAHEGEIVGKIKSWGDGFIQALPSIQHFVGTGISLLGDFFQFLNVGTQAMLANVSLIMQAWGTITGNDKDVKMGQGMMDMANQLGEVDLTKFTDGLASLIEAPTIDTAAIQKQWDESLGHVLDNAKNDHGTLGASIPVSVDPKAPDGSPLTDPKQLFPGLAPDGTLHLPTTLDPPDNRPPPPPDAHYDSHGKVLITEDSPVTGGLGGGPNQPSWMPQWMADILGYSDVSGVPKANADTSAFNPGPRAPGAPGTAGPPGIVHSGDPSDPVHVAVVLSAFSAPLGDPNTTQVPGGGWGKGGGGGSHSANKGFGSTGPGAPADVYDAPTDPRNQLPGKKTKGTDPGDLIGPLMDMLGLGNVLGGVNPEDWGITKFAKGMLAFLNGGGPGGTGGASGGGGGSGGNASWLLNALGMGNVGLPPGGPGAGPGGPGGGPGDGSGGGGPNLPDGAGPVINPGKWWGPKTSYDNGGVLPPGDTHATNQTGGPEIIIPPGKLPTGMHQDSSGKWSTDASPAQIQGAIIAGAQARGFTPDQIHAILSTASDESAFGQNAYGGDQGIGGAWGVFQQGNAYGSVADRQDPNKAINAYLDQFATQSKAQPNLTPFQVSAGLQQHGGPGSPGSWTGSSGDQTYLSQISSPQAQAAANKAIADAKAASGSPPGVPGAPGAPPNPALNNFSAWLSGAPAPSGSAPGFNPLTFGLGLGPGAAPGVKAPLTGVFRPGVIKNSPNDSTVQNLAPAAQNLAGIIERLFPQIKDIGGIRADSMQYHPSGHGLDFMLPGDYNSPQDIALGNQINKFIQDNGPALGVYDSIYRRQYFQPGQQTVPYQYQGTDPDQLHLTHIHGTLQGFPGDSSPDKKDFETDINKLKLPPGYVAPPGVDLGGTPPNVSAAPNVSSQSIYGGPGAQAERRGDTHIHGDYMPMNVTPSAIDPKPAVKAMQDNQNAMVGSAGGFGGLGK